MYSSSLVDGPPFSSKRNDESSATHRNTEYPCSFETDHVRGNNGREVFGVWERVSQSSSTCSQHVRSGNNRATKWERVDEAIVENGLSSRDTEPSANKEGNCEIRQLSICASPVPERGLHIMIPTVTDMSCRAEIFCATMTGSCMTMPIPTPATIWYPIQDPIDELGSKV
jgi:hypothetical protein